MSKRTGPARIKLSDFKERKDKEGRIEIEGDDGEIYVVPPADIWPDAALALYQANDRIGCCREIMGSEVYDKFVAAGGSASILNGIIAEVNGATPGE